LALAAGVTASTASSHLAKLSEAKILKVVRQGRHRYFRLFDDDVASMLEGLMEVAAREVAPRRRLPAPALAAARVCYDHLAGASGVRLADALRDRGLVAGNDQFELTPAGERFFIDWKIDVGALRRAR